MRKLSVLLVALVLLVVFTIPASALTIWYGGDPDLSTSASSFNGGVNGGSMVFDNFYSTGSGWNVYYLIGNFAMDFNTAEMAYEIRSGVSEGNGGTLISSGIIDATQTNTYLSNPAWNVSDIYTLAGNTAPIQLAPGEYWVGLSPVLNTAVGNAFAVSTSGDEGIGSPLVDGNSYIYSANGYNYVSSISVLDTDTDFSYGVFANPVVPEPASMLVLGMGLVSFVPMLRRRK